MGKVSPRSKKKAAAAAKKREMEEAALEEKAAAEEEHEFQKTVLQIRVKELETLNFGLVRKSEYLEGLNEGLEKTLEDVREEKEDLVSHLQRSYSSEKSSVKELEDRLYGTHQAMLRERDAYEQKLRDKDKDFASMQDNLTKKVKDLDANITSLEEFKIAKDKLTEEREELERKLVQEKKSFVQNYTELEDNLIRYKDRLKSESKEMMVKMATEIQAAGKLCLTATVQTALKDNISLQENLEKTSRDNLTLRQKLEKAQGSLRGSQAKGRSLESENVLLVKKCGQFRAIVQELTNQQVLLSHQLEASEELEKKFISLTAEHKLCPNSDEVHQSIADQVSKILANKDSQEKTLQKEMILAKKDITKLRAVVVKMALSAKCLSEATCEEESHFFKDNFMGALVTLFETACAVPNLSEEVRKALGSELPNILPYVTLTFTPKK